MVYTDLGGTNEKVSAIGFGGWAIGGHGYGEVNDSQSISAIHKALDLGINFFDTADVYGFGHSEEVLSKALRNQIGKVVVGTKFGVRWDKNGKTFKDCSPVYVRKALEGSLRRLKTDCIPLYQLHWHDGITPLSDVFGTLFRLQDEGKIRHVGCSNIPHSVFYGSSAAGRVASAQLPYSLVYRDSSSDICLYRRQCGMTTIVYGVLSRGWLSGKYDKSSDFGDKDTRRTDSKFQDNLNQHGAIVEGIKNISAKYRKTSCQVAIRWVLDNPSISCALVGAKSKEQVLENCGAIGWDLQKDDWEHLGSLFHRGENEVGE